MVPSASHFSRSRCVYIRIQDGHEAIIEGNIPSSVRAKEEL